MTDIVERLRERADWDHPTSELTEAATEIESLRSRAEKAEAERDAAVGKHKVWMEKVKQMLHASWRRREAAEATCEKLAAQLEEALRGTEGEQ